MYFQQTSMRSCMLPFSLRSSFCFIATACLAMCVGLQQAWASTTTTTALAMTSGGSVATTVTSGSVVTLTATVTGGGTAVVPGQVNFCDAAAKYCTDIHLLGTAQLTGNGTATLKFRPGIGSHSYKAVFPGTTSAAASASTVAALKVTAIAGIQPSTTSITSSATTPGTYTLTANVSGNADVVPTGSVSFVDTSNANAVLGTASLTPGTGALFFSSSSIFFEQPRQLVAGDFNGDGIVDLLATINGGNSVQVLLGYGDGTFRDGEDFSAQLNGIVVGDFNGDGKLDLAMASGGMVTIFLGKGDGTFTGGYQSPPMQSLALVASGDFNGDGNQDLLVESGSPNPTLTVLLGNGDGTFKMGATVPTDPGPVAVGDFNGDGKLDLAVGNQQGDSMSILLGNGDGTFAAGATVPTDANPGVIAVADFNADGKTDLAVAASGTVTILLGNGDGTFTAAGPATGYSGTTVVVGDFNGDGIVDLGVAGNGDCVLLGNGDGTFTAVISNQEVTDSGSIAVADFNGDGASDLAGAILNENDEGISVLLSQPKFAMASVNNVTLLPTGINASFQKIDANYDGDATYSGSVSPLVELLSQSAFTLGTTALPPIVVGASATSTVTVTPAINVTGLVTLNCSISFQFMGISPPTCSIPPSAMLSGTAAVSATATVSTLPATTPGAYQMIVQGTPADGGIAVISTTSFTVVAPSFALSNTAITIAAPGASGTSTITVTPSNGFTGTVSLSCTVTSSPVGAVDMPACSVSAPAAISGTTPVTATLTIGTTAVSSAVVHDPLRRMSPIGGGVALAALFFFGMPLRRRRLKTLLGLLLLATIAGAGIGCSSAANNTPMTPANPGTTVGSYIVTVTGTSGATTATTAVTVAVD
jgi:trimeric autotransporter adhesin